MDRTDSWDVLVWTGTCLPPRLCTFALLPCARTHAHARAPRIYARLAVLHCWPLLRFRFCTHLPPFYSRNCISVFCLLPVLLLPHYVHPAAFPAAPRLRMAGPSTACMPPPRILRWFFPGSYLPAGFFAFVLTLTPFYLPPAACH